MRRQRWLIVATVCAGLVPVVAPFATGEEPSGLQFAAAMEEVLGKAIEACEGSVVAIARVRRGGQRDDVAATPFNQVPRDPPTQPGDADFIPNEYASGVVVGADGLILTAHHVLRDDSDYWVTTPQHKTYKVVKVVGADPRSDLAVLAIEASDLVPIKFGDGGALKKGQIVVALGNPFAIARDGQVSASWGIVSNLARKDRPWATGQSAGEQDVPSSKPTLHQYGALIQTDARLNLGTSGGALVNLRGEMIGLTVALASSQGYEQSAGFAIPVDETFLRAVQMLKQGREVEYGFLGIKPGPLTPDVRRSGKHGVVVQEVVLGTPAERAGLTHNDVITHIDDDAIYEPDDLMLEIGRRAVDATVRLTIERGGATKVLVVSELAKFFVAGPKIITTPAPVWRGIRVDYVTASRDFQRWVRDGRLDVGGSVLITEVEENSAAWQEGLRANMMISRVGAKSVPTPKAFHEAVGAADGPVKLRVNLPTGEHSVRTIPPNSG